MSDAAIVALVGAVATISAAGLTAYWAKQKEPEDRDSVIAEASARAVEMIRGLLDECMEAKEGEQQRLKMALSEAQELIAQQRRALDRIRRRVHLLEDQVRALGSDPVEEGG